MRAFLNSFWMFSGLKADLKHMFRNVGRNAANIDAKSNVHIGRARLYE